MHAINYTAWSNANNNLTSISLSYNHSNERSILRAVGKCLPGSDDGNVKGKDIFD